MVSVRVKRLANPRKRRTRARGNPRRKLSAKQIKFFGTARQRAALKRRKPVKAKSHRRRPRASNPPRRRVKANPRPRKKVRGPGRKRPGTRPWLRRPAASNPVHRKRRRAKRRSNPALLVTLNPHSPRRKTVAKRIRKRRANSRRRSTRAVNPVRRRRRRRSVAAPVRRRRRTRRAAAVSNPRRRNRTHRVHHRRRRMNGRRRNPVLFGHSASTKEMAMAVAGGLTGVFATKYIVSYLKGTGLSSMLSTPIGTAVADAIVGTGLGWAAKRFLPRSGAFGDAMMFGAWMQTGSDLISGYASGTPFGSLALSGMRGRGVGMLQPGNFVVPQNPIYPGLPAPMPMAAAPGMSGHNAAFRRPF